VAPLADRVPSGCSKRTPNLPVPEDNATSYWRYGPKGPIGTDASDQWYNWIWDGDEHFPQPNTIDGGNVISGNLAGGISIHGAKAKDNQITNNFIGTQADGVSPLGTLMGQGGSQIEGCLGTDITGTSAGKGDVAGVKVENSPENAIGGTTAAQHNVVIQVVLDGSGSTGNVRQRIFVPLPAEPPG
jgi:hypothetical protein